MLAIHVATRVIRHEHHYDEWRKDWPERLLNQRGPRQPPPPLTPTWK